MNSNFETTPDRWAQTYLFEGRVFQPYAGLKKFRVSDGENKTLYDGPDLDKACQIFGSFLPKEYLCQTK